MRLLSLLGNYYSSSSYSSRNESKSKAGRRMLVSAGLVGVAGSISVTGLANKCVNLVSSNFYKIVIREVRSLERSGLLVSGNYESDELYVRAVNISNDIGNAVVSNGYGYFAVRLNILAILILKGDGELGVNLNCGGSNSLDSGSSSCSSAIVGSGNVSYHLYGCNGVAEGACGSGDSHSLIAFHNCFLICYYSNSIAALRAVGCAGINSKSCY